MKALFFGGDSWGRRRSGFAPVETRETMMDTEDPGSEEEDEDVDDFRERAAWQSKFDVTTCFGCGSSFNPLTNRHHHCRACGRVVCGSCSGHKDKVKGYAKPERTCDECHEKLASEVDLSKLLTMLCPCFKAVKREWRKQQQSQVLSDGAVFLRKTSPLKSVVSGLFGGGSGSAESKRVQVALRSDGLALTLRPVGDDGDDETIYLHDVKSVEARGPKALALVDSSGSALFHGDMTDPKTRDTWVHALGLALKQAAAKPPPPRTERSAGGTVANAARRARKEIELQSRKRDAEKRKQDYLKAVGGGLKYTALAMADRGATSLT
mmetsp:Transcript_5426/g.13943  ORF Transcript_5426/g.13943 Transcript_5426/m.13943 type:complete len:323 (+) Transcript_5426:3-971(+)